MFFKEFSIKDEPEEDFLIGVKQSSESEPWIDDVSNYFCSIALIWIGEEGKRCKSCGGKAALKIRIGNRNSTASSLLKIIEEYILFYEWRKLKL